MNLLFILPYSPIPTDTGNKNLTFNLLKYLSNKISIDIIIIIEDLINKEKSIYEDLKIAFPNIKNIFIFEKNKKLKSLIYKLYFLIKGLHPALGNFYSFKISKWLKLNSYKYDLIHFDMFLVSPYISSVNNKPSLLVGHDAYTLTASLDSKYMNNYIDKFYVNYKKFLLQNIEKNYYKKFSQIVCVSNIDSEYLIKKLNINKIKSIGIPIADKLKERKIKHHNNISINNNHPKLLITGNLDHPFIAKNICSFLKNILPEIIKKHPNIKTIILGKNPIYFLKEQINKSRNVVHKNYVVDYFDYLDNDWIYIYPQKCGSGLQTKLQQALASGLPVIAYEVAYGGLHLTYEKNAFKVNEEKDFIKYIDKLIRDPNLRIEIGRQATDYIRKSFSTRNIGLKYIDLYQSLIEKSKSK